MTLESLVFRLFGIDPASCADKDVRIKKPNQVKADNSEERHQCQGLSNELQLKHQSLILIIHLLDQSQFDLQNNTLQIRIGDEQLFERIFVNHYKYLCNYAYYFIHDTEEAREIVQDVFVKFWEKASFDKPLAALKSYLYSSVKNSSIDYLKHNLVRQEYRSRILLECSEETDENFEQILVKELSIRLEEAVQKLPPRCQKIFRLSRFECMKNKDIALEMNISVKAVEAQISKALLVLRDKLSDLYMLFIFSLFFFQ
jgi:RNA polymerase sigma-70 factor, ECF subfamily